MKPLYLIPLLFLLSCAAPHDNPLDPKSDRYVAPQPAPTPVRFEPHVHSRHIARLGFTDIYSVIARLRNPVITQNVDSAWVTYDARFRRQLSGLPGGVEWSLVLSSSLFGDDSLGAIIGQPFVFEVRDHADSTYALDPVYLLRWIDEVPVVVEPDSGDTVTTNAAFIWQPYISSFPFNYVIEISNQTFAYTVWTSDLLPSTMDSVDVPDSLLYWGDYRWMVSVVDQFENTARSKEGEFTILENP